MSEIEPARDSRIDSALSDGEKGIRAAWVSMIAMFLTFALQAIVTSYSHSAALLADACHNFVDAFSSVPLWIAFALQSRKPNRRFTYGYNRFEDIAGVLIVLLIFAAAFFVGRESLHKIKHEESPQHLVWVAAAALIGFVGNEWVARYRIRVGEAIHSLALIADGRHARVDAFTSLGVIVGVVGVATGHLWADPMVGLLITGVILHIGWDSGRDLLGRLADAVSPDMIEVFEKEAKSIPGVFAVYDVRARAVGRQFRLDLTIEVDGKISVLDGHEIAVRVQHTLQKKFPRLIAPMIHVDPAGHPGEEHHFAEHHRKP